MPICQIIRLELPTIHLRTRTNSWVTGTNRFYDSHFVHNGTICLQNTQPLYHCSNATHYIFLSIVYQVLIWLKSALICSALLICCQMVDLKKPHYGWSNVPASIENRDYESTTLFCTKLPCMLRSIWLAEKATIVVIFSLYVHDIKSLACDR